MQDNVLFNPTDSDVTILFNGEEIEIKAGEEVECQESGLFRWILKNYSYKGVVDLNYGESQKKMFKNFEDFKRNQTLKGLKAINTHAQLTLAREQQAVNNSASNGNSAIDKLGFNVKKFEKRIEEIQSLIADLMEDTKELKNSTEKPKRGRKKHESTSDQNESQTQDQ